MTVPAEAGSVAVSSVVPNGYTLCVNGTPLTGTN